MHLGLIVGIGPASTDYYYRYLISAFSKAGLPLELTMAHADTSILLHNQANGNKAAQIEIYSKLATRLKAAGVDILAITSIAGHFCVNEFMQVSSLPVLNLLDIIDDEISKLKFKKLGLIGTRVVMESCFYGAISNADVIAPASDNLTQVHDAYVAMATAGVVTESQRQIFIKAGRDLIDRSSVEAIMLAGTDLDLVYKDRAWPFPVVDCAKMHAAAIVRVIS